MAIIKRACECGKVKYQGLQQCRYCLDCKEELHVQYDILRHMGHRQVPLKEKEGGKEHGL